MKLRKIIQILCYIISGLFLLMSFICEDTFYLLLVSISMGTLSILEYKKHKENDDLSYLNRKLIFIYAIGAAIFLFIFISERK